MRHPLRYIIAAAALTAASACTSAAEHADQTASPSHDQAALATSSVAPTAAATADAPAAAVVASNGTVASSVVPASVATLRDPTQTPVVRALYVNRFAAQSTRRMHWLLGVADSTEINGLVIDMKDEFGLNYKSANPTYQRNAGTGHGSVRDVKALLDTVHAHNVFAIARIVVFKDPHAAEINPTWTIRQPDSSIWRDKKGTAWVDPYNRKLWEYNLGVAEELVQLGFDEIQFDYIRFPEPYKSLPRQVFPASTGMSKPDLLAAFLKEAGERMHKGGVRSTADIFGLVTSVRGPLEVGQWWEKLAPVTDVMLPMVYPSHYPPGSYGIPRPNADPYKVIKSAITDARTRDVKLGITAAEHVRPWLQAFDLGKPKYGPEQITAQKQAVYDAGYDGWVMWHPGSKYEPFIPALERGELVSRKTKS